MLPCLSLSWLSLLQAEQLQQTGGVKDPVYSNLAWGEYEVLGVVHGPHSRCCGRWAKRVFFAFQVTYSSIPQAAGGPVFTNQQLRQTLTPPASLVNTVSFSALGFLPGTTAQPAV